MHMRKLITTASLLFVLFSCKQEERNVITGIPRELAVERRSSISAIRYDLFFDIPSNRKDSIRAKVTISFDLKEVILVQLDYAADSTSLKNISVNGELSSLVYKNEHILIEAGLLNKGTNSVTIEFNAGDGALNRNEEYLYTLFVPSRASTCFPVFDQPDLKAIYSLELSIPADWLAVSNGKTISSEMDQGKKRLHFSDSKPTSSYQFAFAAGKFRQAIDPQSGMTMYYRETDSLKVARNAPRIFELHRQSLAWLEEYTKIDYPYEKFDFALMPAFQFGGMEHPGSIFYKESSLFLETSATVNEELRRASLIAHETAHMWFGNLVTMEWFNDVWLKEVFANFMAAKMVSPSFPEINHDLRFLMSHFPAAYEIDRSAGAHPVQQPLDNLRNAGSVYGAIIYQKAPIMMRNLETWIGLENFQLGLQEYLQNFSYGNATWDDLVNCLKKHTDQDLKVWNKAWIKTGGMPELAVSKNPDGKSYVIVSNDSAGIIWPQTFDYNIITPQGQRIQEVTIRNSPRALLNEATEAEIKSIPNWKGRGYGFFHTSPTELLELIPKQSDVEARAGMWMNVWEIFLRGGLDPILLLEKIQEAVNKEKDPLLLEYLTDKLARVYWKFLTPARRSLAGTTIDDALFNLITSEKDNSRKRTLYNSYRSVASSPQAIDNLKKLWSNKITLGLDLSERDHIQLAYALALREVDGYQEILNQQLQSITNPDRKAEMQFILPALSADPATRDVFFESLKRKENRAREPWVLEAVRYLHHPLRSERSIRYVAPSLQLLEETQRSGDIFFPKGWLDATLGDSQSEEVGNAVRDYLKQNSNLRADLRNKLLQSADMLFRAEQIIKKSQSENPN